MSSHVALRKTLENYDDTSICYTKISDVRLTSVLQNIMNVNEVKKQLSIDEEIIFLAENLLSGSFFAYEDSVPGGSINHSHHSRCRMSHLLSMLENILRLLNHIFIGGYTDFDFTCRLLGIFEKILKAMA